MVQPPPPWAWGTEKKPAQEAARVSGHVGTPLLSVGAGVKRDTLAASLLMTVAENCGASGLDGRAQRTGTIGA